MLPPVNDSQIMPSCYHKLMDTNRFLVQQTLDWGPIDYQVHFSPNVLHMKIIRISGTPSSLTRTSGHFDMTRVRVSDPGSPVELDEINVHFFWRRVYIAWYELIRKSNVYGLDTIRYTGYNLALYKVKEAGSLCNIKQR